LTHSKDTEKMKGCASDSFVEVAFGEDAALLPESLSDHRAGANFIKLFTVISCDFS
jgi:hypothetical protein